MKNYKLYYLPRVGEMDFITLNEMQIASSRFLKSASRVHYRLVTLTSTTNEFMGALMVFVFIISENGHGDLSSIP